MTKTEPTGRYASSPCMAHDFAFDGSGPLAADPGQARDVARWRVSRRAELLAARRALSPDTRRAAAENIAGHVRAVLDQRFQGAAGRVLSAYWPIKAEPDLRGLMTALHASGVRIALPLVETRAAPLVFRCWTPGMAMVRGQWNIPVPPPEAEQVVPDISLAPVMGWDACGYRLGYGGGYFDRTLAHLSPRPFTIGIGLLAAKLPTIFPQPHDIPLDVIVTEAGVHPAAGPGA
jgi:5,10-methenyltetrahydrofolate synthetase